MRRLRTEIMIHMYFPEIWVLELLEDENQNFVVQRHYGHMSERLKHRLDHTNEFFEDALRFFEKKVANKMKRDRDFRRAGPGENIFCEDLFRVLADMFQDRRNEHIAQAHNEPEHRRLEL
jgi:hypothetical protein